MHRNRIALVLAILVLALGLVFLWRGTSSETGAHASGSTADAAGGAASTQDDHARANGTSAVTTDGSSTSGAALDAPANDAASAERAANATPPATAKDAPLLVSGRVVDANKAPLAGARVVVEKMIFARAGASSQAWREVPESEAPSVTTGKDGAFEVRGKLQPGAYGLRASRAGSTFAQERRFTPGETKVELVLVPGGTIAGSVILPRGLAPNAVDVVLEHADGARPGVDRERKRSVRLAAGGRFEEADLLPGMWSVSVEQAGHHELASRNGVSVRSGERTQLDVIDLANELRTVRIEVADQRGALLADARVKLAGDRANTSDSDAMARAPGVFEVLVRPEGAAIVVECAGYVSATLDGVKDDQRVVLVAKLQVQLVARGDEPLSDAEGTAALGVLVESVADNTQRPVRVTFEAGRTLGVGIERAGDYTVTWTIFGAVARPGQPAGATTTLKLPDVQPVTIHVVADGSAQRFELDVPSGALARGKQLLQEPRPK